MASDVIWLGRILVIAGVAVWPLWGSLYLVGAAPHVAWALGAHLGLVLPGGYLVRRHRGPSPGRNPRRRLGEALIVFGVLAWVPYLYLTESGGRDVPSAPFLVWHLSGVIPGSILRYTRLGRGKAGGPA